jgi:hypothetical protein
MHRALAALAAAVLSGCGAASAQPPATTPLPLARPASSTPATLATASPSATATASATPTATAMPSTPSPRVTAVPTAPSSRQVSEPDNGTTVTLRTGGALRAVLHSTYWQFDPASDPTVLASQGSPSYSPDPPGSCVPGGGCGTVTADFQALRPGRAVVTAHRTSCGEALRCTGDAGSWMVTVIVSG